MTPAAGSFAAVWIALFIAHQVGDHWVQTSWQAATKGSPGWLGARACLAHVATYILTAVALVTVACATLDVPLTWVGLAAGQSLSAVTHYLADRRAPLLRIAARLGLESFWQMGSPRAGRDDNPVLGTGAYALDQSFHHLALFAAALVTVLLS